MFKKIILFFVILIALVTAFNQFYLFNPLNYKLDKNTGVKWSEWKKPLEIYYVAIKDEGKTKDLIVKDKKEIKFIINELEKGQVTQSDFQTSIRQINFPVLRVMVRRILKKGEGSPFMHIFWQSGSNVIFIGDKPITLTKELNDFLSKKYNEIIKS